MTVTIDPRIEERRLEVARANRSRRRRILLLVCGAFIVVGVAFLAVRSPLLDVDRIRVDGTVHLDPDEVRAASGVHLGDALLLVDVDAVRERIERLPWVKHADVHWRVPGTLDIAVEEHVPVAYTRRDASIALLADNGVVVADVDAPPPGLVEIVGVRKVPDVGKLLSPPEAPAIVQQLPDALAQRIAAIDLGGEGIALALQGGGAIRLCTADDLAVKADAALAVLERLGDEAFSYIDVCAPQNPVAR